MKIPFVVPVRDRLTYLQALLEALALEPHVGTVHLCDMASTWPQMLAMLEMFPRARWLDIRVHRLPNLGARGLLRSETLSSLVGNKMFFLSDPDVVPERPCTKALLDVMSTGQWSKVGVSLRISDLPDHHPQKTRIVDWERQFWTHPCGSYASSALYLADVDTTFCLVRSLREFHGRSCRVGEPFTARHIPWYEHPDRLPPDVAHYYKHAPLRRWGVDEVGVSWTPLKPR